jgi:hypothetical protein
MNFIYKKIKFEHLFIRSIFFYNNYILNGNYNLLFNKFILNNNYIIKKNLNIENNKCKKCNNYRIFLISIKCNHKYCIKCIKNIINK